MSTPMHIKAEVHGMLRFSGGLQGDLKSQLTDLIWLFAMSWVIILEVFRLMLKSGYRQKGNPTTLRHKRAKKNSGNTTTKETKKPSPTDQANP